MYSIHFVAKETGEDAYIGLFNNLQEAYESKHWPYPGYGHQEVVQISDDEAIDVIYAEIDNQVDYWLTESPDVDPEDYEILEAAWFNEAAKYVKEKRPGYNLLELSSLQQSYSYDPSRYSSGLENDCSL